MNIKEILEYNFLNLGGYQLNLLNVGEFLIILFSAQILVWAIKRIILHNFFKRRQIDIGKQFAITQFLKYIVYTIALLLAIQSLGITLSVIWGGAAALLVGIGLGLQQTFHDLISGIILLIEGSVEIDDAIMVDGILGKVRDIGIRTSRVESRDGIMIIVPNSKLVGSNVVNWSHNDQPTRFQVEVGVSYSSDVKLVTELILKAANGHPDVLDSPTARVQFGAFGESSLDFILHFYSSEYFRIEFVKSDLRYRIIELFRQHKVEIPFPQRDLWIKSPVFASVQNGQHHPEWIAPVPDSFQS